MVILKDELSEMNENERNEVIRDLRKECICHTCPTYNNCTRESEELLYCLTDSSTCPIHKRKCLCPLNCPVYEKFNFTSSFYCFNKENKERVVYSKQILRV